MNVLVVVATIIGIALNGLVVARTGDVRRRNRTSILLVRGTLVGTVTRQLSQAVVVVWAFFIPAHYRAVDERTSARLRCLAAILIDVVPSGLMVMRGKEGRGKKH